MAEGLTLKLIVEKGPLAGRTMEFGPASRIQIGRVVRGNTIAIKDSGISSKHISIHFESEKWIISDLDSSNGTYLNDLQLDPSTPAALNDGDTIKIGEYTLITVQIEKERSDDSTNQLRRNPRRGTKADTAAPVAVAENRGRRGRAPKVNLVAIDENCNGDLGLDEEIENNGVRNRNTRGRPPRKPKITKNEVQKSIMEIDNDKESNNGGVLDTKLDVQVISKITQNEPKKSKIEGGDVEKMKNSGLNEPRRTRQASKSSIQSSQKVEDISKNGSNFNELDSFVKIEHKNRKGRKGKKNDVLQEESKLGQESCKEVNQSSQEGGGGGGGSGEGGGGEKSGLLQEEEVKKRPNLGNQSSEGLENMKGKGLEVGLENMTLGQWLDYLVVYLPKQIHDESEEFILDMEQKTKQFRELNQKKKEKAKGKEATS